MAKEEIDFDDEEITISDENGKEETFKIYFRYENEDRGVKYVVFYSENDEDTLYAYRYDDEGNLQEIEDEEEFNEVQEVISAFEDGDIDEEEV